MPSSARPASSSWRASGLLALGLVAGACLSGAPAAAQSAPAITLSGATATLPFRDFATREMGDPWDMSQRTDLGWFTWGADAGSSVLVSRKIATDAFGNTYFSAQVAPGAYNPQFVLLDTWLPGSAKLGKDGGRFPIDTTVYNVLYVKMKIGNDVLGSGAAAQIYWSRDTVFYDASLRPGGGMLYAADASGGGRGVYLTPSTAQPYGSIEGGHWVIYRIPLTIAEMKAQNGSTHIDHWQNVTSGANSNWGSAGVVADSLRVQPMYLPASAVGEIQVDWARLVSEQAGGATTVSWTGGGLYDIVVSTRSDCSDFAVLAYSASSGYQLQSQALPPAVYRVGLRAPFTSKGQASPGGNTLAACSSAAVTVRSYPTLSFSSPSDEGSADDFATSFLSNPWDFDALTDVDLSRHVSYPDGTYGIVSMPATDPAGNDLGPVRVLRGVNSDGVGDPHVYTLWSIPAPPAPEGTRWRGLFTHIDASRYRILTTEIGVERSRDVNLGSIARVIWHVAGDVRSSGSPAETESQDIILHHLDPATENGGRIVLEKLQADMADRAGLPLESDIVQSASGWGNTCIASGAFGCNTSAPSYKPGIDMFRLDFHEFPQVVPFEVRRIKLAALERTGGSFLIRWSAANPDGLAATLTLKAVPEANPAAGDLRPADRSCAGSASITIASGLPLGAGAYTWVPSGLPAGGEYYVCGQVFVGGLAGAVGEVMSRWPVVIDTAFAGLKPTLQVDRARLHMAAVSTGTSPPLGAKTPAETVRLTQNGAGTVTWTASLTDNNGNPVNWLSLTPSSGTGTGAIVVALNDRGGFPFCTTTDLMGAIRIASPESGNSPQYVQVSITIYPGANVSPESGCTRPVGSTAPPFGQVDTPAQNATGVVGAIGVTGWALDDVGVQSVKIYRNCLPFENQASCRVIAGANVVFIGDAAFLPGARPDVEAAFSTQPLAYKAGWGYLMLTNMLPDTVSQLAYGGQGQLTIYAIAADVDGHRTILGRTRLDATATTITLANATIAKPFGAIDTPLQGQTVSGIVQNFGWVLTPDADTRAAAGDTEVPVDGSTMVVVIDGAAAGHVTYNQCRGRVGNPVPAGSYCDDDVANIFGNPAPQPTFTLRTSNPTRYRNLDAGRAAIGSYDIDTTKLSNGLHTIAWGVTDSAGRAEGIGSRFFIVQNGAADSAAALGDAAARPVADEAVVASRPLDTGMLHGRSSFNLQGPWEAVPASADGGRYVRIPEMGRLELFGEGIESGFLVVNGSLRPLPIGSQLLDGRFTWSPVAGYLGEYRLVFLRGGDRIPVSVTVYASNTPSRVTAYLDDPVAGASVSGSFRVAGWAADLTAWNGTGIGAVHVWARRRSGLDAPVFLGAAEIGGVRPDVAAAFGQQFGASGWGVAASLPPGAYDVIAYFWSTRTGRFEDARTVVVTVR